MKNLFILLFLSLSISLFAKVTISTVSIYSVPKAQKEVLDKKLSPNTNLEYRTEKVWWTSLFQDSSVIKTYRYLGNDQLEVQTEKNSERNIMSRVSILIGIFGLIFIIVLFMGINSLLKSSINGMFKVLTVWKNS